jgi:hypothetical protein
VGFTPAGKDQAGHVFLLASARQAGGLIRILFDILPREELRISSFAHTWCSVAPFVAISSLIQ